MTSSNLPPPSLSSIDDQSIAASDVPSNSKEHLQQQAPDTHTTQQSTSSMSNLDNNKQQQRRRHSSRSRSNSYTLQSTSLKILPEDIPIESIDLSYQQSMSNNTHNTLSDHNTIWISRRRSSSLSSDGIDKELKDTTPPSITSKTDEKKRESWQINTDWDYNNLDSSFNNSQASLYHVLGKFAFCVCVGGRGLLGRLMGFCDIPLICVYTLCKKFHLQTIHFFLLLYILDELNEEQNDELADVTKQTTNEEKEKISGDTTTEDLDKPHNNIGEEFELPIQFESSSVTAATFSKPVRNNNTSMGSLKLNNETRRSDSNRSFGSKGSSKGSNAPKGRYSIDANNDFGSLLLNNNMNKKGLLSKAQTQSLKGADNNNNNSSSGGSLKSMNNRENKTYKRSVQDTLRHDEGLASSIFSRNSDCSFGSSASVSDRSGSGSNILYGSSGTSLTSTTNMANESWTTSNNSGGGAGERLNELDEYWSGTNLGKSQVKQQHAEPWTLNDLVLDDKKE